MKNEGKVTCKKRDLYEIRGPRQSGVTKKIIEKVIEELNDFRGESLPKLIICTTKHEYPRWSEALNGCQRHVDFYFDREINDLKEILSRDAGSDREGSECWLIAEWYSINKALLSAIKGMEFTKIFVADNEE